MSQFKVNFWFVVSTESAYQCLKEALKRLLLIPHSPTQENPPFRKTEKGRMRYKICLLIKRTEPTN
jgi:hypothetical protein